MCKVQITFIVKSGRTYRNHAILKCNIIFRRQIILYIFKYITIKKHIKYVDDILYGGPHITLQTSASQRNKFTLVQVAYGVSTQLSVIDLSS
jgi:hypothetical protein